MIWGESEICFDFVIVQLRNRGGGEILTEIFKVQLY